MDWGNCILRKIHKDANGVITSIDGDLHLEGDFKKTKLKLTWLADVPDVVPLCLVHLDHLITKAKVSLRLCHVSFELLNMSVGLVCCPDIFMVAHLNYKYRIQYLQHLDIKPCVFCSYG